MRKSCVLVLCLCTQIEFALNHPKCREWSGLQFNKMIYGWCVCYKGICIGQRYQQSWGAYSWFHTELCDLVEIISSFNEVTSLFSPVKQRAFPATGNHESLVGNKDVRESESISVKRGRPLRPAKDFWMWKKLLGHLFSISILKLGLSS